jgi:transposase
MLEDAAGIRKVVIACGYVDLRKGIDGLSMIIGDKYKQNPFEKGTLFLFCGRRSDRLKGLLWMGNEMVSCFSTSVLNPEAYRGHGLWKRLRS